MQKHEKKMQIGADGIDNHLLLCDPTALGIIGTPAMTSRGCLEDDFAKIADFLFRTAHIISIAQREHGKSCKDFLRGFQNNKDIIELRNRVETFASQFAMPGFNI